MRFWNNIMKDTQKAVERVKDRDKACNSLIESIKIDKANLYHIADSGKINGTLYMEIRRIMEEYAAQKVKQ